VHDGLAVVRIGAYLVASNYYQDDINDEDYSREEGSWQDDCEAGDRGKPRSTIAFGPI